MTVSEIFINIAINFFTAAVQELGSRFEERAAAAGVDAERWWQRSKGLETRMAEALAKSARCVPHSPSHLDALRGILKDQVFISQAAGALIAGTLRAPGFAAAITERDPSLEGASGLEHLATALIEGFNAVVAADPELAALVGLRRSEDLKQDVKNVSGAVQEIGEGVLDLRMHAAQDREEFSAVRHEVQELRTAFDRFAAQNTRPSPLDTPVDERLAASTKRRFDNALNELKNGSATIAAEGFRGLLADLSEDRPEEKNLLFRTTNNLGIALHYLGDYAGAAGQFERAFELKPDSVRAKANKILAALTAKDFVTADRILGEALASEPNDIDLIRFKAQLLSDKGKFAEAIAFLEQRPRQDENYFIALAIHYNQASEYEKGAQAARSALELNPESDGALAILADAIAMPIVFRKTHLKLPAFALSSAESEALREAVKLSERALKILRRSEHKVAIAQVLINLSAYSAASGDYLRAVTTAEEAAVLSPGQPAALANLYMAQMHLDRFDDAVQTARHLATLEDPTVATMREMDALMGKHDFPQVIELYRQRSATNAELLNEPHAICILAEALFRSFETEGALKELESAATRLPNHPLVLLAQAHIHVELNDSAAAESYFDAAVQHAQGQFSFLARQQLGLFHYHRENWKEAEKHLLGGIQDPRVSPFFTQYLICLYNLGRYRECLGLAQSFISAGEFRETIWELATNCHLQFKDLHSAEELLNHLVRHSTELRHWLKLFEVTYRLHDVDRARKVLRRAYSKHANSFAVIVNLSGIEFTMGHYRRAFNLAQRAVELQPDNPEGHRALMRCGLFSPETEQFSDNEKEQIQASIAYLAGLKGSGVEPFEIKQDLSNLTELMRKASETAGKAEELFSTKGLPMAFLARVLGKSPFTIWRGLTVHHRLFVPMALGSQEEQDAETKLATAGNDVVLDASALFTLKLLDKLPLVPKLFRRVYVPTAVFERIKAELDELTAFKGPEGLLGYAGGGLVFTDVPNEAREAKKSFLEDLLTFLRSDTVTLSGIEGTIWEHSRVRKTIENLGESGDSIAVATGRNIPLYSDDVGIRALARNEHKVAGFCTQALLRAAVAKNNLSPPAYEDALLLLFRHNYHFVSEGAETVIRGLEQEKFVVSPLTTRLVSRIAEPSINQFASATILGNVLGHIWLYSPRELRSVWVDIIAEKLASVNAFADVCSALFRTLVPALFRTPAAFFGVSSAIVASRHLSRQQIQIWRILSRIAGRAAVSLISRIYPIERELTTEWHEHLRISSILDSGGGGL